jgi:hypothetical protein
MDMLTNPTYPKRICAYCTKLAKMNFDPIKFPNLFNDYRCPSCHATNTMIWQNSDLSNSHQVIANLLSVQSHENEDRIYAVFISKTTITFPSSS